MPIKSFPFEGDRRILRLERRVGLALVRGLWKSGRTGGGLAVAALPFLGVLVLLLGQRSHGELK